MSYIMTNESKQLKEFVFSHVFEESYKDTCYLFSKKIMPCITYKNIKNTIKKSYKYQNEALRQR